MFHSCNHPDLKDMGSPKTKKCMKVYREKCKQNRKEKECEKQNHSKPPKVRWLSNLYVSEFLIKHNIRSDTELFAKAHEQKDAGKKDLAYFVMSRTSKSLQDVIRNTWKMYSSSEKLNRQCLPRMEIIKQWSNGECVDGSDGIWLECATEVLTNNRIHPIVFAQSMRELLEKGCGKIRNVMIVGPANCAETFLLTPLTKRFDTFSNPANNKYAC